MMNLAPPPIDMTLVVPTPAQRNIPADLIDRLKQMTALLEMPIIQLVQHEESLRAALDTVVEYLPSDLVQRRRLRSRPDRKKVP